MLLLSGPGGRYIISVARADNLDILLRRYPCNSNSIECVLVSANRLVGGRVHCEVCLAVGLDFGFVLGPAVHGLVYDTVLRRVLMVK